MNKTIDNEIKLKFSYDPITGRISRKELKADSRHTQKFCD